MALQAFGTNFQCKAQPDGWAAQKKVRMVNVMIATTSFFGVVFFLSGRRSRLVLRKNKGSPPWALQALPPAHWLTAAGSYLPQRGGISPGGPPAGQRA